MKMRSVLSVALAVLFASLCVVAQVKDFHPVTEAMLRNPAPGDWLNWRRTDNAWGYSPLDQINRQNVRQLQLAWSWAMDDTGAQEATPLVHDGVMYLPNPRGVIQALDAATGDLIWEYRPTASLGAAARRRRRADGHPAPRVRRRWRRYGTRDPEKHRHLRRQDLRDDERRAHRRPRRADREARGTPRSRIRSWATATHPAPSSCAGK